MSKTYLEMVTADVLEYLRENAGPFEEVPDENLVPCEDNVNTLYDLVWADDSITGNGSGSYTRNRYKAMEYVFGDYEAVNEAFECFDIQPEEAGKELLEQNWEWFDVLARLGVLAQACWDALEAFWKENHKTEEQAI